MNNKNGVRGPSCPVFILFVILCLLFSVPQATARLIIPSFTPFDLSSLVPSLETHIPATHITLENKNIPAWKVLWDQARMEISQGNHVAALSKYEAVISIKPNLNIVRWEFSLLCLKLNLFDRAEVNLELLTEQSRSFNKLPYLRLLGFLAYQKGQHHRAVELFKRAIGDDNYEPVLVKGLINSLYATGRTVECLELLEDILKQGEELKVKLNLAVIYYSLGLYEKAKPYLIELVANGDILPAILLMTARGFDYLGLRNEAILYWLRLVKVQPDCIEAHEWLGLYYEMNGEPEKALVHLLALENNENKQPDLLLRIGRAYLALSQLEQALPYLNNYINLNPASKEAAREIIRIYASLGNKAKTLIALEHYFTIEESPGKVNLKQAADLYNEKGFYLEAIPLYRRLLDLSPDDPVILWTLAKNLLEAGRDADALTIWQQLAQIVPGVVEVYRPMAMLLERLGRNDELAEVLSVIHELEPQDQQIIYRLAELSFAQGKFDRCMIFINRLTGDLVVKSAVFEWRGAILVQRNMISQAVAVYDKFLELSPGRDDIRLKIIRLAGQVGDQRLVAKHTDYWRWQGRRPSVNETLEVANAFLSCVNGSRARAQYRLIIEAQDQSVDFAAVYAAFSGIAASYVDEGRLFEAEQTLRQAAIRFQEPQLYAQLFSLALAGGRGAEAKQWLDCYLGLVSRDSFLFRLMEARYEKAMGKAWFAGRISAYRYRGFQKDSLTELFIATSNLISKNKILEWQQNGLALAEFYLAEEQEKAERICQALLAQDGALMAAKVILLRIYRQRGDENRERELQLDPMTMESVTLRAYARFCRKYELFDLVAEAARHALQENYGLFWARLFLAQALDKLFRFDQAAEQYLAIIDDYPDCRWVMSGLAAIYFKNGRMAEAEQMINRVHSAFGVGPDTLLLQARVHWMKQEWQAAIALYNHFLDPPMEQLVVEKALQLEIEVQKAQTEKSPWKIFPFWSQEENKIVSLAMAPAAGQRHSIPQWQHLHAFAIGLYAQYRWQEKFAGELRARRFVVRQEYFLASKQYESLVGQYPNDSCLLFDLAAVYSRLGKLGAEAALYEKLRRKQVRYPELADAIKRNKLKRKPRLAVNSGYNKKQGRREYKDMEKNWQHLSLWYSPGTQKELDLSATLIEYLAVSRRGRVNGSRITASYTTNFLAGLSASLGSGYHTVGGDSGVVLLQGSLTGKLKDSLWGKVAINRDVIEDNTASLTRKIIRQNLELGVSAELLPRLAVGGNYLYTDYSDSNWTTGYDLWTSYVILPEPTFLRVGYIYDFKESKEWTVDGNVLSDGFAAADHPYWAPKNYWKNGMLIFFKHRLAKDAMDIKAPQYYTVEYFFGHDSDGYGFQMLKGGFFFELTSNIIVKAAVNWTSSQPYRDKQAELSVAYRW